MSWVTVIFSMTASACLTLVLIYGFMWWRQKSGEELRSVQLGRDLRAKDQQMTLAAEAANMGFWFRDFAREDFWASNQWRSLFGFTSSETLYIDKFLQRLHPNDREPTLHALDNAYQGDGNYQTEHRVLLPDGQVRWIACQGRVEFNSDHQPLRLQGVSLDITGRKMAELEAQAHRNEVAHLLRVASLGELASGLAHELSQPLTAILGNAEAARLFIARNKFDPQEIDEILSEIVADDKRAGEVVRRMRALLKKGDFQPEPLEGNDLIQEVLKLLRHDLTAHTVRVVTDLTGDLPTIRGDRVQLQQVLINLILNASDAMSQLAENARTLTLRSCRVEDDTVEISVADTGCGIPSGGEEKIFEPYHTTKPLGLGLGLSLSRSIVLAHGGRLWAENKPKEGAIFHLTIPSWRDAVTDR
jgi:two-component system sensor kinase FixL